jgi:hypothetical protein
MVIKMKDDYLARYEDGRVFKLSLDGIRTYHRVINEFDMFVYNLTQRGKSHGWVCIDSVTGACIDNKTWGHKLKENAFKSATDTYNRYTREEILGAHQNALRQLENGKMDREEGGFNKRGDVIC